MNLFELSIEKILNEIFQAHRENYSIVTRKESSFSCGYDYLNIIFRPIFRLLINIVQNIDKNPSYRMSSKER